MAGKVTISIELELGWGKHDIPSYECFSERRSEESKYLDKLLNICDKAEIPITFDIVGHIFRKNCNNIIKKDFYSKNWWCEHNQASDNLDPLFHAPDLVQKIQNAEVNHEIATHTYSHIMMDEVEPSTISYELNQVREVHNEWDIDPPNSIVAPRHRNVEPEILRENDIKIIREPSQKQSSSNYVTSIWLLTRSHPVQDPETRDNLVRTYSTSYPSLSFSGGILPKGQTPTVEHFRYIPLAVRQYFHKKYLREGVENAIRKESHAHFWTHLWDMANKQQWDTIRSFLIWLGEKRRNREIKIDRMEDIANKVLNQK